MRFEDNEVRVIEARDPAVPDADIWARFRCLDKTLPPTELRGGLDTRYLQPLLYFLARTMHARTIVEIGAGLGGSCLPLLKAAAEMAGALYAVDPNVMALEREHIIVARYGCEETYRPTHMTSDEFFSSHPDLAIDFAFVDGEHSCAQVMRDADNVLKRLVPGGMVVFHEYDLNATPLWDIIADWPTDGILYDGLDHGTPRALRRVLAQYEVDTMPLDFGVCGKSRVPEWTEAGALLVRKRRPDEFLVRERP